MIAKFRYHSENAKHSEIQIFAMHGNFLYDRKKLCIAKISLGLRNFRYGCEIFAILAKFSQCIAIIWFASCCLLLSLCISFSSFPLDISSFLVDEITVNSQQLAPTRHQTSNYWLRLAKTCQITKNKLETESVVLSGPAHVNWLNSYD